MSTDLVTRSRQVHRRGNLVVGGLGVGAAAGAVRHPSPTTERLLVDGGVLDNLPVDLLTERAEGPVVAVNISMGGGGGAGAARTGPARVPALGETLLRTMMIGSGGAVAAARDRGAFVVTPATMGVGLLEFHQFDRMVRAGRLAARALLDAGRPGPRRPRAARSGAGRGRPRGSGRTGQRLDGRRRPSASDAARPRPVRESVRTTLTAVRRPTMRRALIAFLAFSVVEWAVWLALLIWAYDRSGVGGASLVSVVQLIPAVVVAPLAASWATGCIAAGRSPWDTSCRP